MAQPEPDIGGNLVVARAPGVKFFADAADALGQRRFDIHMDVFAGY